MNNKNFLFRIVFFAIVWAVMGKICHAQEILATVKVDAERIESSDKSFFKNLEVTFTQFLNNRRWTTDKFSNQEKIKMNINIRLIENGTNINTGDYKAEAQVQFSRPVYGTAYESLLFSFYDKDFDFKFLPGEVIDFNENTYISNIGSLLSFFVYIGLGMDYDSFGKLAGTPYFEKANLILTNAQNAGFNGWRQTGTNANSRYWLMENLMNPTFTIFREATYTYYREGLDKFTQNSNEAIGKITQVLSAIKTVNDARPNSCLIRTYFNTKDSEFIKIYSDPAAPSRAQVVEMLKNMDPTNTDNYEKILSN